MRQETKISVVIPLYNKELSIRRTIESVLRQNTIPDEIIVVDDGSTDAGASIVGGMQNPLIHLIQQQNGGGSVARNRGVAEARNNFVAFLDADDEWKPEFLDHIHRLIKNFPDCGAYATAFTLILPGGTYLNWSINGVPPPPWIGIIPNLLKMLQTSPPFMPSSIVMPKQICQDLGGFPPGVKLGEDLMLWIRLGIRYPIAFSPSRQVLYHADAENRACLVTPWPKEDPRARIITDMLRNNEVPDGLVQDMNDYLAFIQIKTAAELIKTGDVMAARAALNTARKNRKYARLWNWWYLCSFIPQPLISYARKMKPGISDRSFSSSI